MNLNGLRENLINLSALQVQIAQEFEAPDAGVFQVLGGNPSRLLVLFWTDKSSVLKVRPVFQGGESDCWSPPVGQTYLYFTARDLPGVVGLPWQCELAKDQKIWYVETFP